MKIEAVAGIVKFVGPPAGTNAEEWVALAQRESSLNEKAVGPSDSVGGNPIGLWQIKYKYHAGKAGGPSNPESYRTWLMNPTNNFSAAKVVYAQQGWPAWQASHTPTVESKRAVQNAELPTESGVNLGGVVDAAKDPVGTAKNLAEFILGGGPLEPIEAVAAAILAGVEKITIATKWISNPDNWIRIMQVGGGILLAAIAASIVLKPAIQDVKKTVSPI